MTHPLYDELNLLAATDNGRAAVKIARTAQSEYGLLKSTREACRRSMRCHFFPEIPAGMMFQKDNFWAKFEVKGIWYKAWEGRDEHKEHAAAWLRKERETAIRRGDAWPPKPMFQKAVSLPQPKDGKSGATCWTPRKD